MSDLKVQINLLLFGLMVQFSHGSEVKLKMKNNIKKIIKEKNLKITDVINQTELSKSYFYDVMNGNNVPTLTVARKISDAINETLDKVFPDEEDLNE
ncbi:helix-turn-helix domain-containing protein [Clostridium tetani]|uniref:helix-turn-helix domain-containing protein n=1 Tax=Clostridium tetani TaxID=1513 RepID=UPI001FB0DC3E|nr:helix-turn-helix transcriptional regulator [Clostridium tetani]